MNNSDLKDIFLNTVKPHIGNDSLDEHEIFQLHLNDTEIDSLMLMEIIMELESRQVKVRDNLMSSLPSNVTLADIFGLLVEEN